MNWKRGIRIIWLLPFAWIACRRSMKKPFEERYRICRHWSKRALRWGGLRLEVHGLEHLPQNGPLFFASSHQGTIDPAVLISALPMPVSFISKQENESIPILGDWARAIETIHFDRSSRKGNIHMFRESIRRLKAGDRLLVFPEGTRSFQQTPGSFHPQALQPGVRAGVPIVPVALVNAWALDRPSSSSVIQVCFGRPLDSDVCRSLDPQALSDRVRETIESLPRTDQTPDCCSQSLSPSSAAPASD